MFYLIALCVILFAFLWASWRVVGWVAQRREHGLSKIARVLLTSCLATSLMVGVAFLWLTRSYHGDATAKRALLSDDQVAVSPEEGGYLFDGPGEDTVLVFLPGAKVQAEAYAPLMHDLAAGGIDCLLVDPPFNIAFLAASSLEDTVGRLSYDHLMMAGHSMGGVVAASYAAEHPKVTDALVLLAAYPTDKVPEDIAFLSVYGTQDTVLNPDAYDNARNLWPSDARQLVIAGGNHAGFGCYGRQTRDGKALITQDDQREQTVTAIIELARHIEEDS